MPGLESRTVVARGAADLAGLTKVSQLDGKILQCNARKKEKKGIVKG